MHKIDIVPFKVEHAVALLSEGAVECHARIQGEDAIANLRLAVSEYEGNGTSYSGIDKDGPLFCAMLKPLWSGVMDLAVIYSVRIKHYVLSVVAASAGLMDDLFKKHGLHRIQTTVRCDFPVGIRFAEYMGFTREGVARKHGHDQTDAYYYAVVR